MGKEATEGAVILHRLTQQQAAALIGVTARTLRDWADAPRNLDESYNGPELVQWLLAKRSSKTGLDLEEERARLAKEQADKAALDNAVRRSELADLAAVAEVWGALLAAFRARMLATPSKLAPTVNPGNPNLARDAIEHELSAILAELADVDVRGLPIERPAETGGPADDPPATAEAEGQRVGRPRKAAKSRKQRRARTVAN